MASESVPPSTALERGLRHVEKMWLPYDRKWVSNVRQKLRSQPNDAVDSDELLRVIFYDAGLLGVCLRSLGTHLSKGRAEKILSSENPIDGLRTLKCEEWLAILPTEDDPQTLHEIDSATTHQAARARELITSISASEALAPAFETSPEVAGTCAFLRQLGLALVAWNYPHIYVAAADRRSPSESLDRALSRKLGFTPLLLATSLARNWGLSAKFLRGMGWNPEGAAVDEAGERLEKLCKLGEVLAMSQSPESYPERRHDWDEAKIYAERCLGADALANIFARAERNLTAINKLLPPPAKRTTAAETKPSQNRFPSTSPTNTQVRFEDFYKRLPQLDTGAALEEILQAIAPTLGFTAGALFVAEPDLGELSNRLSFSNGQSSELVTTQTVRFDSTTALENPIVDAWKATSLTKGTRSHTGSTEFLYFATRLEPGAVLYLECVHADDAQASDKLPLFQLLQDAVSETIKNL